MYDNYKHYQSLESLLQLMLSDFTTMYFYDLFGKIGDRNVAASKFEVSAPPELLAPSTSNIHSAQGCLMASTKYPDSNAIVIWHNKTSFLFMSIIPAQSLM